MSEPSPITYSVLVGWDTDNWMDNPPFDGEYDDITADVKKISTTRGKEKEAGNMLAATLDLNVWNPNQKYSPSNAGSPIHAYMKLYKQIKVVATHLGVHYPLYYGFIEKYQSKPHWDIKEAMFYCTDGMDLLARTMIGQDESTTTQMDDGTAAGKVLDATGWSLSRRNLDTSGGNILNYPLTYE